MFKLGEFFPQHVVRAAQQARASPETCPRTGKVRHKGRRDAEAHLAQLVAADDRHADRLKPYRCWSCGDWHVGHV